MKNRLFPACLFLALGLLIVATPYALFPVCPLSDAAASGAAMPMKCFWTARAALGLGLAVILPGGFLAFAPYPGLRLFLALALLTGGLLTAAVPLKIIGVCSSPMMPCRMGTLPALCLLGLFTGLGALAVAVKAWKALRAGTPPSGLRPARVHGLGKTS